MLAIIKFIKTLLIFIISLAVVGFIALALFMNLSDPNQYKSVLISMLEKATHQSVKIQGNIRWTVFPDLSIEVNQVNLSNNSDSNSDLDFKTRKNVNIFVQKANIKIAILPLLKKYIQINALIIDGLTVNLIKNPELQENTQPNIQPNTQRFQSTEKKDFKNFKLSTLAIKNSEIMYDDQMRKKIITLKNLNFTAQNIVVDHAFPLQTQAFLSFNADKFSQPMKVNLNAQGIILSDFNRFRLEKINSEINYAQSQYHWQGVIAVDLSKKDLSGIEGNIAVFGNHTVFYGMDLPYYSHVAEALLHKEKPTLPNTHQTTVRKLQGIFEIKNGIVNNQDFRVQTDQIDMTGQGTINLMTQALDYELSLQGLKNGIESKPSGPAIPFLITGSLSHPDIRPNWQLFLVYAIKQKLAEKIQQNLQRFLNH